MYVQERSQSTLCNRTPTQHTPYQKLLCRLLHRGGDVFRDIADMEQRKPGPRTPIVTHTNVRECFFSAELLCACRIISLPVAAPCWSGGFRVNKRH
jgi:hypothetical protein